MSHLNLTFEQSLTFLMQRRPAVCPNDGFQRLYRWDLKLKTDTPLEDPRR